MGAGAQHAAERQFFCQGLYFSLEWAISKVGFLRKRRLKLFAVAAKEHAQVISNGILSCIHFADLSMKVSFGFSLIKTSERSERMLSC